MHDAKTEPPRVPLVTPEVRLQGGPGDPEGSCHLIPQGAAVDSVQHLPPEVEGVGAHRCWTA